MRSFASIAWVLGLVAASEIGFADAKYNTYEKPAPGHDRPLRDKSGLQAPRYERAVRLRDARVLLADYGLIRTDFGTVLGIHYDKPLARVTDHDIDGWLLDNAAYVSRTQADQSVVNTSIAYVDQRVTAFRPRDYGRALVFQPRPGVLLDVKGAGARKPAPGSHSNGLATLGESIREYLYEKLLHRVLQHSDSDVSTVGHYAVIDAGFDVKFPDGRQDRAGLIVRQAHERAMGYASQLSIPRTREVETLLRGYGLTAAGAYREQPFDMINVQGTKRGALLDFGGFLAVPWFDKPGYHFSYAPDTTDRSKPIFDPHGFFIQPDERIRVPFEKWGYTESGRADPVEDNPWRWSHRLANDLRMGKATRVDVEQHAHNLLDPVEAKLAH